MSEKISNISKYLDSTFLKTAVELKISNKEYFEKLFISEQIFSICNGLAAGSLVTYKVVPINTSLGMLQFIDKTSTLIDLVPNLTKEEALEIRRHLNVQDPTTLKESLKV